MKRAGILVILIDFLFWIICCSCCCNIKADADSASCMVICEVPEEPVKIKIPKVKGKGFYYIEESKIIYQVIERK